MTTKADNAATDAMKLEATEGQVRSWVITYEGVKSHSGKELQAICRDWLKLHTELHRLRQINERVEAILKARDEDVRERRASSDVANHNAIVCLRDIGHAITQQALS